ncbi:hypothetical protein DL96DRAFT_1824578 [Flagelloscypha sp. PMI_526]|nr:hypothetical protein DL96DRAFT_1824578 [Flagelloscypha sp. PMI_526]
MKILKSSPLGRLDLVRFYGGPNISALWMHGLVLRFIQLPQLQYLTLELILLLESDIPTALRVKALQDLDASDHRLSSTSLAPLSTGGTSLPILDTLRIRLTTVHWRKLIGVVDISRLKRLAVWDFDGQMEDLANDWGRLVTWSALTLESLSLWLTPNITEQDIPEYLRSIHGLPALTTLSLFHDVYDDSDWTAILLPILTAFHACSPLLRHVRLYVQWWMYECNYAMLLRSQFFADFAKEVKRLQNLETMLFSFNTAYRQLSQASKAELALLVEMFHPVKLWEDIKDPFGGEWPFYQDDLPPNVAPPS